MTLIDSITKEIMDKVKESLARFKELVASGLTPEQAYKEVMGVEYHG